jgi:hypothetical protein
MNKNQKKRNPVSSPIFSDLILLETSTTTSNANRRWKRHECARFKKALLQYGLGRWEKISAKAPLDPEQYNLDEVEAFGLALVKKCVIYLEEDESKSYISVMNYILDAHQRITSKPKPNSEEKSEKSEKSEIPEKSEKSEEIPAVAPMEVSEPKAEVSEPKLEVSEPKAVVSATENENPSPNTDDKNGGNEEGEKKEEIPPHVILFKKLEQTHFEFEDEISLNSNRFAEHLKQNSRIVLRALITLLQLSNAVHSSTFEAREKLFDGIEVPESDFGEWWGVQEDIDLLYGAYPYLFIQFITHFL